MPMIINGASYSAAGWWGKHLQRTDTNERVSVIEFQGLIGQTIPEALREMGAVALGTRCKNYFYQANINPRADESLNPKQWERAVELLEHNLGLAGQPRFVVEHEKEGRVHRHVVWSRIDPDTMTARSDSLTAAIHERTSRQLEVEFDLERGKSILVPDRDFARPERGPKKWEIFRGHESKIDPKQVAAQVQDLKRHADGGRAFIASLNDAGYIPCQGDKRDFCILDQAGQVHSLGRRVGMKAPEFRAFMRDVDLNALPSVDEAKDLYRSRGQEEERREGRTEGRGEGTTDGLAVGKEDLAGKYREVMAAQQQAAADFYFDRDAQERRWEEGLHDAAIAAAEAREQTEDWRKLAAPQTRPEQAAADFYFDRDAQARRWEEGLHDAAIAAAQAREQMEDWRSQAAPQTRRETQPERKVAIAPELAGTAAEIRLAMQLTASAQEFANAIEDRGLHLARVVITEAVPAQMEREEGVARGRYADLQQEEGRKGADRQETACPEALVVVNQFGSVYRLTERNTGKKREELAEYLQGIDRAPLLTVAEAKEAAKAVRDHARNEWREQRAAERAERDAERRAAYAEQRGSKIAHHETVQDIGQAYAETHTGPEFAARLESRGLIVAHVTQEDADRAQLHRSYGIRTEAIEAGQFVAFNERGQLYRLDATTIHDDEQKITARLAEIDASQHASVGTLRAWFEEQKQDRPAERSREGFLKAPDVGRGLNVVADVGMSMAGSATRVAAQFAENILGSLTDFFTGGSDEQKRRVAFARDQAKEQRPQTERPRAAESQAPAQVQESAALREALQRLRETKPRAIFIEKDRDKEPDRDR